MKLSSYHKQKGDNVEWYTIFNQYDIVYMAKVFTHTPDYDQIIYNSVEIIKGGTGYDITSRLPQEVEKIIPDYSLYPNIDNNTAYGFLTRGCIRKCQWCIVPKKEGTIQPYQDVDEIAVNGRTNLILMDNNILAAGEYGINQLKKIASKGYKIDFNQAMDARLVDDEIAQILANIKWSKYIRFGCDTPSQIKECENAINLIQSKGYNGGFFLYTILRGDIRECYERVRYWKNERFDGKVKPFAQPELDFSTKHQNIPQWQKDMAHWVNKKTCFFGVEFEKFSPRKGFSCSKYFE
ncbi:MAG: radical SAM protein [Bacteroidales bacterium]|nr:radical SAM protein [Bacteroidales bacterium]